MNHYVKLVHKFLGRYINRKISSSTTLPAHELALDVEDFLHEACLVVNQRVPTNLQEIEKNKQLKSLRKLASVGESHFLHQSKGAICFGNE